MVVRPVKQSSGSRIFCDGLSMSFFHFLDVRKNCLFKEAKTGLLIGPVIRGIENTQIPQEKQILD